MSSELSKRGIIFPFNLDTNLLLLLLLLLLFLLPYYFILRRFKVIIQKPSAMQNQATTM